MNDNSEMNLNLMKLEDEINSIHKVLEKSQKPKEIMEFFCIKKRLQVTDYYENEREAEYLLYLKARVRLEEILFDLKKFRLDHFEFEEIKNLLKQCSVSELHYVKYLYWFSTQFITKKYFRLAKALISLMKLFLSNSKDIVSRNQKFNQEVLEKYLLFILYSIEKYYLVEILKCYKSLVADPDLKEKLLEIKNFDQQKSRIFKDQLSGFGEQEYLVDTISTRSEATKVIEKILEINQDILELLDSRNEFLKINEFYAFDVKLEKVTTTLLRGNLYFDLIGFADELEEQLEIFQTASSILIESLEEVEHRDVKIKM
jgi:hypothetical protein